MSKFRDRIDWVYRSDYFTPEEQIDLVLVPKSYPLDRGIFVGLLAVSFVGAALVGTVVWFA